MNLQDVQGPNVNAVWIALIGAMSTMLTTLLTFWMTRNRLVRTEDKADVAATRADVAAAETVKGNEALAEVHKTVNGKNDALMAENRRLQDQLSQVQVQLAQRRASDPPTA
jgi:hypothetical protein